MSGGHRTLSAGRGSERGRTVGGRARRPPGRRRRRSRRQRRSRPLGGGPRDDGAAQARPSRGERRHAGRRAPAGVVSERRDRRGPALRRHRSLGQADREHPLGHVGCEQQVKRGRRLLAADLEGPGLEGCGLGPGPDGASRGGRTTPSAGSGGQPREERPEAPPYPSGAGQAAGHQGRSGSTGWWHTGRTGTDSLPASAVRKTRF